MVNATDSAVLKSGEKVSYSVVRTPDGEWSGPLGEFLGHKGGLWHWQIEKSLTQPLGCDTSYYILHRDGVPFSGVMLAESQGIAILGHVFTSEADRRQGACTQIMERLMDDFRVRGGRAMTLSTGYDSAPFHLYKKFGFEGLEPENGHMWYAEDGLKNFDDAFFADGEAEVESLDWANWPLTTVLYTCDAPARIRSAPFGIIGRVSTEGSFLSVLQANGHGHAGQVSVLMKKDPEAAVGAASWGYDRQWPGQLVLDLFCHAAFWGRGPELLAALEFPAGHRHVAYADSQAAEKREALLAAGFEHVSTLPEWVPSPDSDKSVTDVDVMVRKG